MLGIGWAFGISVGIALLAGWRGSLSRSGVIAAVPVGGLILGVGGWAWGVPLFVFFVTSSGWSHYRKGAKREVEAVFAKGASRDWGQVLANGGLGTVLVVLSWSVPHDGWYWAYLGVMASVTADTWATELGTLSRGEPRYVLTGRPVPRGTSGGVSVGGSLAATAGALVIGLVALGFDSGVGPIVMVAVVTVSGTVGAFVDSVLGATLQARFQCDACERQVESAVHCDQPATHTKGLRWINNDLVNVTASAAGGLLCWGLVRILT